MIPCNVCSYSDLGLKKEGISLNSTKSQNVLQRNLVLLEAAIYDHAFNPQSPKEMTRGGSELWGVPECLWGKDGSVHGASVDMYFMRLILLWLAYVYAHDGEQNNKRQYNELLGHKICHENDSSNRLEETIALTTVQMMAA